MRRPADVSRRALRGGARSMTSSERVAVTIPPASVRRNADPSGAWTRAWLSAANSASSLPSSTGPSFPTWPMACASSLQRDFCRQRDETLAIEHDPGALAPTRERDSLRGSGDDMPQRILCALQALRQRRETLRGQPFGCELRHDLTQTRSGEARITVARIVGERDPRLAERRNQAAPSATSGTAAPARAWARPDRERAPSSPADRRDRCRAKAGAARSRPDRRAYARSGPGEHPWSLPPARSARSARCGRPPEYRSGASHPSRAKYDARSRDLPRSDRPPRASRRASGRNP